MASFYFEGTSTLIVLDDCAASKDMKGQTGELVKLGFSARHAGISVWVVTQQLSSIAKPFRENVAAIVLFYMPSAKTTKAIFEEYISFFLCAFLSLLKRSSTKARWNNSGKSLKKSWREMQPGSYRYHGIEHRGPNDYGRPISVVTLEREGVKKMYYAPSSLYWDLKNR